MSRHSTETPDLPVLLWKTPPTLAPLLEQEGVPCRVVGAPRPFDLHAARFVLAGGGRAVAEARRIVRPDQIVIDVESPGDPGKLDPFEAVGETRGRERAWRLEHVEVIETVASHDRAAIRRRLMDRIGERVRAAGGIWARLAPFPYPWRSAVNLRVDLDEPAPDDYAAFARARRPIEDATTHFISTAAYGEDRAILADLGRLDSHSHGHHHTVYREPEANLVNLRRARRVLDRAGITGRGFAGPSGRWNRGLDAALEAEGHTFSGEFQVGYGDTPFYPWLGDRPSTVLQIPVHPICEGLFLDAGAGPAEVIGHLTAVIASQVAAGVPAFVYGHPERRLGRHPEIVAAIAEAFAGARTAWRVTLGAFADWWRWRGSRSWSLRQIEPGVAEIRVDDWDARHPLAVEVVRGRQVAVVPLTGATTTFRLDALRFERRPGPYALPPGRTPVRRPGLRRWVREAIDWDVVTPIEDLPTTTIRSRIRRQIRIHQARSRRAG